MEPDPRDPVAVRRHVHARPELGFCEIRTADLAWRTLERLGWSVVGGTALTDAAGHPGLPPDDELEHACAEARAAGVAARRVDQLGGGHTALVAELAGDRPGPTVGIRVERDALPVHVADSADHPPARAGFASRPPAGCTRAGTTGTSPSASPWPRGSRPTGTSPAGCGCCSSRPRRACAGRR